MGYIAISQILLAIQTFGQKKVCRGRKSSSMPGNMFATQGFQLKKVCRGKNKKGQENRNRKRKYQRRREKEEEEE